MNKHPKLIAEGHFIKCAIAGTKDDAELVADCFRDHETARRLVACWNACEGIDTKMLERFPLNDLGKCIDAGNASTLEAIEVTEQRDALLKALINLRHVVYRCTPVEPGGQIATALSEADLAIAKIG